MTEPNQNKKINLVHNMHGRILKMIATNSGFLIAPECTKFVFGRGSAPDVDEELMTLPHTPSRLGRGKLPRYSPLGLGRNLCTHNVSEDL